MTYWSKNTSGNLEPISSASTTSNKEYPGADSYKIYNPFPFNILFV